MTEFVGLRTKMYALPRKKEEYEEDKEHQEQCCNKIYNVRRLHAVFDAIEMTRRQSCIRSKLHEVYTISKIALNPHDQHITPDSTDMLSWGYYRCK